MPRKCAVCHLFFSPIRPNQVVCGAACRAERVRAQGRASDRTRYARNPAYRRRQIAKSAARFRVDAAYRARLADRARERRIEQADARRVVIVWYWWSPSLQLTSPTQPQRGRGRRGSP